LVKKTKTLGDLCRRENVSERFAPGEGGLRTKKVREAHGLKGTHGVINLGLGSSDPEKRLTRGGAGAKPISPPKEGGEQARQV